MSHTDRRDLLKARNRIKAAIRAYFEVQGFTEVDTPNVQISPGNEIHLHGINTDLVGPDLQTHNTFLRTSPEFALKKILTAGEDKIFSFAPCFRNRETGPLHHHEFMMVEWYRTNKTCAEVINDTQALVRIACEVTQISKFNWRDNHCDPRANCEKFSVVEAFNRYANIDLTETFDSTSTDRDKLMKRATSIDIACAPDDTWSDIFSRILTSRVEPNLGIGCPTFLYNYPISEAAWAAPSARDPKFADRFELYCCGIELANGASELTDPQEQHRRMTAAMKERQRIYGESYPIDEEFLSALSDMPPAAGVALGFDRLVMLATGAQRITDVMWAPLRYPK